MGGRNRVGSVGRIGWKDEGNRGIGEGGREGERERGSERRVEWKGEEE
jgi:hypothetical protein